MFARRKYNLYLVETPRDIISNDEDQILLALMKIRTYGRKLSNNKITWCFYKV